MISSSERGPNTSHYINNLKCPRRAYATPGFCSGKAFVPKGPTGLLHVGVSTGAEPALLNTFGYQRCSEKMTFKVFPFSSRGHGRLEGGMSNLGPFSLDLSTLSLTPPLPVSHAAAVSYLQTGSQGLSVAACSSHGVQGSRVLLGLKQGSWGGGGELLDR